MSLVLVTAPDPILSLEEVKLHLRVDHDDDDDLIAALIEAAVGHIDGDAGWLGRALGPQTWDWKIDACDFPPRGTCGHELVVPLHPLIEVTSITVLDDDGHSQAWEAFDAYGIRATVSRGVIVPVPDGTWPTIVDRKEAVTVRFVAGYAGGDGESPEGLVETVPAPIKAALKLMIGDLYANRETVAPGSSAKIAMSTTVEALLEPFRVWRL